MRRFAVAVLARQRAAAQRRRMVVWLAALAALAALILAATAELSARSRTAAAPSLDDPTIVAIFDAANAADIETGKAHVPQVGHRRGAVDPPAGHRERRAA